MSAIPIARPAAIGIDAAALRRADDLVQRWLTDDHIPAAGWTVGRRGRMIEPRLVARRRPDKNAPALPGDGLFLVASLSATYTAHARSAIGARQAHSAGSIPKPRRSSSSSQRSRKNPLADTWPGYRTTSYPR